MLTTTFGLDFIQRTLRTTGVVLIILFFVGCFYFRFYDALALLSAGVWGMVNLIFLSALVRTVIRPEGIDKMGAIGLAIIKFPLLYATLYFLVANELFRPGPLLIGISITLAVMVLKAVARAWLGLDFTRHESRGTA